MTHRHRLAALQIADQPARWEALGFAVSDDRIDLGGLQLQLGASGQGIVAWALDPPVPEIDGLPTFAPFENGDATCSSRKHMAQHEHVEPPSVGGARHPNGATGLDHVVVATPDFDRTGAALEAAGLPFRRVRDAGSFRQGFRRLGPAILEVVEAHRAPPGSARFWGLVIIVSDLEALSIRLTHHLGDIKPAVQPGRHIATLKPSAGLSPKVAFMDPES
jgi:hypothetical protein